MKIIFTMVLLSLTTTLSAQDLSSVNTYANTYSEIDEWVVVLSDPRPARLQGWVRTDYGKNSGDYRDSIELKRFGKKIVSKYDMELRDQWFIESLGVYCLVVRFNNDHAETLSELERNKSVQWVQPSNDFELFDNDSGNSQNVNSDDLAASAVLPDSADGEGIVIAIIDSAVDEDHQDLVGSIAKSDDFVIAGKKGGGGEAHGTAIAGVITTQPDTKLGVVGVSPAAKLEI